MDQEGCLYQNATKITDQLVGGEYDDLPTVAARLGKSPTVAQKDYPQITPGEHREGLQPGPR